jgi:hypothetical protein
MAKKIKALEQNIGSTNQEDVIKALDEISEKGSAEHLPMLIELLSKTKDETVYNKIIDLLYSLKIKDAGTYLAEAIQKPEYAAEQVVLIASFWQSGIDASPYLSMLVNLALQSDFEVCFECATVIDTIEQSEELTDEEIMNCLHNVNEYLSFNRKAETHEIILGIKERLGEMLIG